MLKYLLFIAYLSLVFCEPTIYLKEEFLDDSWTTRWVESTFKGGDQGTFKWSAGKYFKDAVKDKGIQTSADAKFYGISTKLATPFTNENKPLVIQFQVKHEQNIDCGGGYIKILGSDIDQKNFHGETPYKIMFGPDICGVSTKKIHVIFNYKGKNHLVKKDIACGDDDLSHLYTLIVRPDNTYEVLLDNAQVEKGNLEDDFDFLQPKRINDPSASKPSDWDDREKIDDPDDVKPADFDKPKTIVDPAASKPADWDSEMDGEWEAPQIDNPEYKGEWAPKQIDNPAYKGEWVHPTIDNPEYSPDPNLYLQTDIGSAGFDLWQVKSGTIFDNVLITDDPDYAKSYGDETWKLTLAEEKVLKEKADAEEKKKMEELEKESKKLPTDKPEPDSKPPAEDDDDDDDESEPKETSSPQDPESESEFTETLPEPELQPQETETVPEPEDGSHDEL